MYEESIRHEFSHQAESFAASPAMSATATLGALVELAPAERGASWLDVACGPGLVARALAGRVGSVHGVDLTPEMLAAARREADATGLGNVGFSEGDAADLDFEDDRFDGAITRFSLHHIPVPGRVVAEMARVVRPGGWVVVADHVTDPDTDAATWHQEIERLRDPSHWACRTPEQLQGMGAEAGLVLDRAEPIRLEMDFDEWLGRGSGGTAAAPLIDELLERGPPGAESFRVTVAGGARRVQLRYLICRWRVPEPG